jgi:threonine dehydrogenase-like Zn-dependent dehydrogenase
MIHIQNSGCPWLLYIKEEFRVKALVRSGNLKLWGGYKYIDVPVPNVGDDDLLLEVKAAAICGTDKKNFGIDNETREFLSVWGHEFSGVVAKVGKNVTAWKVGDRVVSDNTGFACGKCHACSVGNFQLCPEKGTLGIGIDGGFTKYVKIPGQIMQLDKNCLFHIPDNVSFEAAALLDPISCAYWLMAQNSNLLPGEDVVIYGAGPIGLFTLQIAKIMGAANIILVGLEADQEVRFKVAEKIGATHLIAGDVEDTVARINQIAGKNGIGLVVDCAGTPIVLKQALEIVRNNGQIIRIGLANVPLDFSINDLTRKAITLTGSKAYNTTSWKNSINLLQKGRIDVESMITHRLPLSRWEEGFKLMMGKKAVKVIFHYDGD